MAEGEPAMGSKDHWDWVLLATGCFIAVATLTRLMLAHRNKLLTRLRTEMEQERAKKLRAQQKKKQQEQQQQQAKQQPGRGTGTAA
jgi:hypothetical protein